MTGAPCLFRVIFFGDEKFIATKYTSAAMKKPMQRGKSYSIRPLRYSDTRALLKFANTLIDEDTFLLLSGKRLTMKDETAYVKNSLRLMRDNQKIRLVIWFDTKIIASAEIRRGERRKYHVGEVGIAIVESFRGKGIGNMLMERLILEGRKMGLKILMLHTFENNRIALGLFKKFGFIRCGYLKDAYAFRGGFVGEVTLYKQL